MVPAQFHCVILLEVFLTLVLEDSFTHEKRFAMFSEFKRT